MANKGPIEGVEGVAGKGPLEKTDKVSREVKTDETQFDALMEQKQQTKVEAAEKTASMEKPSLEDVVRTKQQVGPLENINKQSIIDETERTLTTIDRIKERLEQKLASAEPSISKSYNPLLRNKLSHIDDSLKIALTKAGAEIEAPTTGAGLTAAETASATAPNPVERFLGHLSHAQYQLESLGSYLKGMDETKGEFSPASLLAVQIKVNHVQQELEFFSNMLNKALESTKTIMNVQI